MRRGTVICLLAAWGTACGPSGSVRIPSEPPVPVPAPAPVPEPQPPAPVIEIAEVESAVPPTLTVDPPGGTFDGSISVTLSTDDPDATVIYTVDGRLPVSGDATTYTGPFDLTMSTPLRAVAINEWGTDEAAPVFLALEPDLVGFSTNLPIVVFWSVLPAPQFKTEEYTAYTLTSFESVFGVPVTFPAAATLSTPAGLKIRGSSTAGYPKHPYRVETWSPTAPSEFDVPLLGMPEEADWIFGAPLDFDRAFVRDALMFQLSNQIGRQASRTRFAEVFVAENGEALGNDDYVGIYYVAERVERDADRVDITQLLPTDLALPALSGGYLFKEDRTGPDEVGFTAGTADGVFYFQQPFVYADPAEDVIVAEQRVYLTSLLDELGGALASPPTYVNPTTLRHYDSIIDVDAWIDHHLLNVFAKNPDAFRLSGYFHQDRDGLLNAGPVWDFDRTMGCSTDSRAANPTWWDASNETTDTTYVFEHGFWLGLFSDPVFRDRYFARLSDLLVAGLSEADTDAAIDAMSAELTEAAPRNYAAWSSYPPRGGSFEAEIVLLKDWIAARRAWMTACLALPDPRTCQGY